MPRTLEMPALNLSRASVPSHLAFSLLPNAVVDQRYITVSYETSTALEKKRQLRIL